MQPPAAVSAGEGGNHGCNHGVHDFISVNLNQILMAKNTHAAPKIQFIHEVSDASNTGLKYETASSRHAMEYGAFDMNVFTVMTASP